MLVLCFGTSVAFASFLVDDFESGNLNNWVMVRTTSHTGVSWPRITYSEEVVIDNPSFGLIVTPSLVDEDGTYYLSLMSAEWYEQNTNGCSLYREVQVPDDAHLLTIKYEHSTDDQGSGQSRFYITDTTNTILPGLDSGWINPEHLYSKTEWLWKKYTFNVEPYQGMSIRIWIETNDGWGTWSSNKLYVDDLQFKEEQIYESMVIDDFEYDYLEDNGWVIEQSAYGSQWYPGVEWPRTAIADETPGIGHDAVSGTRILQLYSAVGSHFSYDGTIISLYKMIQVPEYADYLSFSYMHCSDDGYYGSGRIYIADGNTIVADTGWVEGDHWWLDPWQDVRWDVSGLAGKPLKLWIGIKDEAFSASGTGLLADYFRFELIPPPDITVSPLNYDYEYVEVGVPATAVITISNDGESDLVIDDLVLVPSGASLFYFSSEPDLPLTLPPGWTVDVEITFVPQLEGSTEANFIISSDDPDESIVEVQLVGTGVTEIEDDDYNGNLEVGSGEIVVITSGSIINGNIDNEGGMVIVKEGSSINGNIKAWDGGDVSITGSSYINGTVEAWDGSDVSILDGSEIVGNVKVKDSGCILEITYSTVGGNVETEGVDSLTVTNSVIGGNIISKGDKEVIIENNIVTGEVKIE